MKSYFLIVIYLICFSKLLAQKKLQVKFVDDITHKVIHDSLIRFNDKNAIHLTDDKSYQISVKAVKNGLTVNVAGMEPYVFNKSFYKSFKKYNNSTIEMISLTTRFDHLNRKLDSLIQYHTLDTIVYLNSINDLIKRIKLNDIPSSITPEKNSHYSRIGYLKIEVDTSGIISYQLIPKSICDCEHLIKYLRFKLLAIDSYRLLTLDSKKVYYTIPLILKYG